jgi:sterol desaturase/sphingolipid hydroxylase (fatty acid hydroxylase superfamily)
VTLSEGQVQLVRGLAPFGALLLGLAFERLWPHAALRPAWRANVGLWAVSTALTIAVCGACGFAVAGWAEERGVGLLNAVGAPTLLGVVATVLALDAVSWFWHWANHRVPVLWRFHRVHHADEAYHVTTALRFHPGEILLSLPLRLAAIAALGASPFAVVVFELVFGIANVLEHGNFDVAPRVERALGRVVITPAQHRFHHVRARPDRAANFGTIFTLWDRLARTFAPSSSAQRFETGVVDERRGDPESFAAMLVEPLRR